MPKRQGYVYDRTWQWDVLKEADRIATKRKHNYGVKKHEQQWIKDLVDVQQRIIARSMTTGEYHHMLIKNGKKVRHISKLHFHPSHEWHQSLVQVSHERIERSLIRHTYASREGYGQVAGALQVKQWLRKCPQECLWYAQGDIRHYYANISHELLQGALTRLFKDREFVSAYMEPFKKFAPHGRSIPLGTRPSQYAGNVALSAFDRFMKEEVKAHYYLRYLDDFVVFGRTKGQVRAMMKRAVAALGRMGFDTHEPVVRPVRAGLDFLGYVFYNGGNMFWRKRNKANWLKRRARLHNPRRINELDSAAWGMMKWGNKHCKKLYTMTTGVNLADLGLSLPDKTDKQGKRIIDAPKISTAMVLNKEGEVVDWVRHFVTSYGPDRYALAIELYGSRHKLITNSIGMKQMIDMLDAAGVTSFKATVVDKGGAHYEFAHVSVLTIHHRPIVKSADGTLRYADTQEPVKP